MPSFPGTCFLDPPRGFFSRRLACAAHRTDCVLGRRPSYYATVPDAAFAAGPRTPRWRTVWGPAKASRTHHGCLVRDGGGMR